MRIGSLFSGYGGLDLAVESVLGARTVWHSELDPAASIVLAERWPGVPNLGDIERIDWSSVEPVDVICGGFPCQDISSAGRRAGIEGERSGLWRYQADAVRVLRPRLVVVENVSALLVRGLDVVLGDLAALGYDTRWGSVRASDVGAPHRRERIFLVAWPAPNARSGGWDGWPESNEPGVGRTDGVSAVGGQGVRVAEGGPGPAADATVNGLERSGCARDRRPRPADDGGAAPDPDGDRCGRRTQPHGEPITGCVSERLTGDDPHRLGVAPIEWGPYEPAIRRWERLTRPAPAPTEPGRTSPRLSPRFVEWMMGVPDGWVTDLVGRTQALRMLGNGVVPQQAAAALCALLEPRLFEVEA